MELTLCLKPPTKKDFINALYFIQQEFWDTDDIDAPIHDEGPSRRWMQMVADELVKPCKHLDCSRKTGRRFQLVEKCYCAEMPALLANSVPNSPYFQSDVYESANCCKIDSEATLRGDFTIYGFAVARDLLQHEVNFAEQTHFEEELLLAEKKWKKAFMEEMRLLVGIELMPQERRFDNNPYMTTFVDAAEHRHLDR
jgi:hypothetical protein